MIDWKLKEEGFDKEKISYLGNKFLIGNGYMGVRGTLAEYGKENLAAINLAGIYDKVEMAGGSLLTLQMVFIHISLLTVKF